ncbi:Flp family type IVb pilin [Planctellipticum variicoloris]|uniref:Flp family type IVb pilin n=1 Tax=Planctellipticum variicoloris TaxID=3064265 RepID=UPI00301359AB|nr:hypothetical protein SH412_002568 [Planctomycetaceae bacterium SH412]
MKTFTQFWADERGFVVSSELVLIATIVVIGLLAGLTTLRDQVALEMGDFSQAIGFSSQSYSYTGVTSHSGSTAGSQLTDSQDFCQLRVVNDLGGVFIQPAVNPNIVATPE